MVSPTDLTCSDDTSADHNPVAGMLAKLKPFLILMGATLQAASDPCACETCQTLRANAANLAPLLLELAGNGGE